MPMKREFVNVDTEVFSATVPSVGMLKAQVLLNVMLSGNDGAKQFGLMVVEFRNLLTEERRETFDGLSMDEWVAVLSRWIEVSADEKHAEKKWWKFW